MFRGNWMRSLGLQRDRHLTSECTLPVTVSAEESTGRLGDQSWLSSDWTVAVQALAGWLPGILQIAAVM